MYFQDGLAYSKFLSILLSSTTNTLNLRFVVSTVPIDDFSSEPLDPTVIVGMAESGSTASVVSAVEDSVRHDEASGCAVVERCDMAGRRGCR